MSQNAQLNSSEKHLSGGDLGLDHVLAVQPQVEHTAVQVDGSFGVQLLQNSIQGDEGPRAPDSSTDMQTYPVSKDLKHRNLQIEEATSTRAVCGSGASVPGRSVLEHPRVLPAVHHGGSGARRAVHVVPDRPDELDQGLGALGHAVIGPHRVVEVTQHARVTAAALLSQVIISVIMTVQRLKFKEFYLKIPQK